MDRKKDMIYMTKVALSGGDMGTAVINTVNSTEPKPSVKWKDLSRGKKAWTVGKQVSSAGAYILPSMAVEKSLKGTTGVADYYKATRGLK